MLTSLFLNLMKKSLTISRIGLTSNSESLRRQISAHSTLESPEIRNSDSQDLTPEAVDNKSFGYKALNYEDFNSESFSYEIFRSESLRQ
jgi:RecB family exonuclease